MKKKDSKVGSHPHAVIHGLPKDQPFPAPGRKAFISTYSSVDKAWLQENLEQDIPSHILEDTDQQSQAGSPVKYAANEESEYLIAIIMH